MSIQNANASVPANIRKIIEDCGLKQYVVAERAGINNHGVCHRVILGGIQQYADRASVDKSE